MDLITFIAGYGNSGTVTPGANTPSPYNVTHVGFTDGSGVSTASKNMAEFYNRVNLMMQALVIDSGDAFDPLNWVQPALAVRKIAQSVGGAFLPISGGTLTGSLTLAGNATSPLHPVTLQQFTATTDLLAPKLNATFTGTHALPTNTTINSKPAAYIDARTASSTALSVGISSSTGGMIVKAGQTPVVATDATIAVVFDPPFPNACIMICPVAINTSYVQDNGASLIQGSLSASGATLCRTGNWSGGTFDSDPKPIGWIAVGF